MTIAELLRALRTRRLSMWLAGGATFALVVAFVLLVPPRYRSEALLRVASKGPDAGLLGSLDEASGLSALGLGRDDVETEIGVLDSRRMQDAAIDSLGLEVMVTKPRSGRTGVIEARSTGESTLDGTIRFARTGGNAWSVAATWHGDSARIPASATTGQPVHVGPLDITVVAADTIAAIELQLLPRFKVLERFADRLQVRRRSPGAKLIEVRFEDRDRRLTARVVGVIVGAYLDYTHGLEMGDARKSIVELRHSADSVAGALRAADERTVLVCNVHCTSFADRRLPDAELLRAAEFASSAAAAADVVVLAGDFNVTTEESTVLRSLATDEWGFTPPGPGIDHVLVRGAPAGPERIWPGADREYGGVVLSDHAPVEVELT